MFVRTAASHGRLRAARALAPHTAIAMIVALLSVPTLSTGSEAKAPGRTYCFYKTCHRVKSIAETQALVGRDLTVMASHYDSCKKDRFNPCGLTSSGEPFFPERADNAASPILPDGTVVMVWSKATKEAVVLRINNAGPYWGNRKLDLSRAAARKLGIAGVGEVTMRVLKAPTVAEARYAKNRRYEPVAGPIGQFASLDDAQGATGVMVADAAGDAVAVADIAPTANRNGGADLSAAFNAPLAKGFALPKGALADALIAQSRVEQRVVTAVEPMMAVSAAEQKAINVTAVTPKLTAARIVAPRRTRVRAIEVKPVVSDPLTVIAQAVTDLIDPPRVLNRMTRAAKPARVARKAPVAKAAVTVAAVKPRAAPRLRVARVQSSEEFRAGHTTYAEDRYRKPVKAAAVSSGKKKVRVAGSKAKSSGGTASGPVSTKQAGINRAKKSAALKKAGGWQSSAVFDVEPPRPALTGRPLRVPAQTLPETPQKRREPLRRVQPSTLV